MISMSLGHRSSDVRVFLISNITNTNKVTATNSIEPSSGISSNHIVN